MMDYGIICKYNSNICLAQNGNYYVWGDNTYNQLLKSLQSINVPLKLELDFIDGNIKYMELGLNFILCSTIKNKLYTWGSSYHFDNKEKNNKNISSIVLNEEIIYINSNTHNI